MRIAYFLLSIHVNYFCKQWLGACDYLELPRLKYLKHEVKLQTKVILYHRFMLPNLTFDLIVVFHLCILKFLFVIHLRGSRQLVLRKSRLNAKQIHAVTSKIKAVGKLIVIIRMCV